MITKLQAKHIPDISFLLTIEVLSKSKEVLKGYSAVFIWELERAMPHVPNKVLRAKAYQLIKRGLLEGCSCGCNGQFEVTEKGMSFIGTKAVIAVTNFKP